MSKTAILSDDGWDKAKNKGSGWYILKDNVFNLCVAMLKTDVAYILFTKDCGFYSFPIDNQLCRELSVRLLRCGESILIDKSY